MSNTSSTCTFSSDLIYTEKGRYTVAPTLHARGSKTVPMQPHTAESYKRPPCSLNRPYRTFTQVSGNGHEFPPLSSQGELMYLEAQSRASRTHLSITKIVLLQLGSGPSRAFALLKTIGFDLWSFQTDLFSLRVHTLPSASPCISRCTIVPQKWKLIIPN